MADNIQNITVPVDGIELTLPEDQKMTKITLEPSDGGITLAVVGSASAAGERQKIELKPTNGGITLAVVGSASGVK